MLSGMLTLASLGSNATLGSKADYLADEWHVDARVTRQQPQRLRDCHTWWLGAIARGVTRDLSDSTVLASFGDLGPEAHLYCNIDLGLCATIGFGSCSNIGLGIAIG